MGENMFMEEKPKQYCIRKTHVIIIVLVVVVSAVAVGLGVGLSMPKSTTPAPTTEPTKPPAPERGPCLPSTDSSGDWKNFRLPNYVNPVHYNLNLEPDLENDVYKGTVEIQLKVSKPTRHLWLHIRETFVSEMPKLKMGQKMLSVERCFEYRPHQYIVVESTEELPITPEGEYYTLSLDFQGWLNGSVVGFYRVIYTENGVTK